MKAVSVGTDSHHLAHNEGARSLGSITYHWSLGLMIMNVFVLSWLFFLGRAHQSQNRNTAQASTNTGIGGQATSLVSVFMGRPSALSTPLGRGHFNTKLLLQYQSALCFSPLQYQSATSITKSLPKCSVHKCSVHKCSVHKCSIPKCAVLAVMTFVCTGQARWGPPCR